MVGALKSNRCDTCRKRKVKCDEVWPICGPCQRGNRYCPPRPSLKVIDDGARVRRQFASSSRKEKNSQTEFHLDVQEAIPVLRFQKAVSLSPSEELCFAFINCLDTQNPSYSLKILGSSFLQVPQRFGCSAALDAVAACIIASHSSITQSQMARSSWRINRPLYACALRKVQDAIDDPMEWKSTNTLCAIFLLHRTESVFGGSLGDNVLVHGAGLAALVKKRGPPISSDSFDWAVIMDSHMCIVENAILHRKDCFLAEPQWLEAFGAFKSQSQLQLIYYELLRQMVSWSALIREKLDLRDTEVSKERSSIYIFKRLCQTKSRLYEIGQELDAFIDGNRVISHIPSTCLTNLVEEMYCLLNPSLAVPLCYHAMYSIIVLRIMISVASNNAFNHSELEFEILSLSKRIWMLVDHGRRYKPLGVPVLSFALSLTMESVEWEAQKEITAIVNGLETPQGGKGECWTTEKLIQQVKFFRGDLI